MTMPWPQRPTRVVPAVESPAYDSKPLLAALAALSPDEIESMLLHIGSLESSIAKLDVAGEQDEMMHLVSSGLRRLTFFLDAVQQHHNQNDADGQSPSSPTT